VENQLFWKNRLMNSEHSELRNCWFTENE